MVIRYKLCVFYIIKKRLIGYMGLVFRIVCLLILNNVDIF